MAKSAQTKPETTLDKFKKFTRSKRFKTMCEDNFRLKNFDENNIDSLLKLKETMDNELSWKKPSPDIRNKAYLQHIIGDMVENYINVCDAKSKEKAYAPQVTKNSYAQLPKKREKTDPKITKMNNTRLKTYLNSLGNCG